LDYFDDDRKKDFEEDNNNISKKIEILSRGLEKLKYTTGFLSMKPDLVKKLKKCLMMIILLAMELDW
jgi:hypothetical protein